MNKKAATSETEYDGITVKDLKDADDIQKALNGIMQTYIVNDDVVFVCVGTDRSTGDALAPIIGTLLTERGYKNVIGTLEDPVHAMNLEETIQKLPKGKTVIAIDACLGNLTSVGTINVKKGTLKAGAGVNKELPEFGDYCIVGIVNVGGFMEYFVLQNTRLSLVMNMANQIVNAIVAKFPLVVENKKRKKYRMSELQIINKLKNLGLRVTFSKRQHELKLYVNDVKDSEKYIKV